MTNLLHCVSHFMKSLIEWLKNKLTWLFIFLSICGSVYAFDMGVERGVKDTVFTLELERRIECGDTPTRTGWLAVREGEFRCFMEHKEFPHRAKGAFIISSTFNERVDNDLRISPFSNGEW